MELTLGRVVALWAFGMMILSTLSLATSTVHARAVNGDGPFLALVGARDRHVMTIAESGSTVGSPVSVSIAEVSGH